MFEFETVYNFPKFYLLVVLTGAVILTVVLAAYTWCANLTAARRLSQLCLLGLILALQSAQFLAVVSPPAEFIFFVRLQVAAFCLLGPAFYIFIRYSLHSEPPGRKTVLLFLIPAAGLILILLQNGHGRVYTVYELFFIRFGPVFYLLAAYNYFCALAALVLPAYTKSSPGGIRIKFFPLASAVLFLSLIDLYQYLKPGAFPYHLFPAALAGAQLIFLTGYAPRQISPKSLLAARSQALDGLGELIIMTDRAENIIFANQAAFNSLPGLETGSNIEGVLDSFFAGWQGTPATVPCMGELAAGGSDDKYYSYSVQAVRSQRHRVVGRLYTFRDITPYKRLIGELAEKSSELSQLRRQLQEYTAVAGRMAEEEERNRILKDVHKTVGEQIAQIIGKLGPVVQGRQESHKVTEETILESIACTRAGIQRIRDSVSLLKTGAGGGTADDKSINS